MLGIAYEKVAEGKGALHPLISWPTICLPVTAGTAHLAIVWIGRKGEEEFFIF